MLEDSQGNTYHILAETVSKSTNMINNIPHLSSSPRQYLTTLALLRTPPPPCHGP
jgi:hypothetical protein